MASTWVVLADEGHARILEKKQGSAGLAPVKELDDPAARAHNADFRHDAYGRRAAGGASVGTATASAGEEKLDHEAALFARRVAQELLSAYQGKRFDELRIAAAPKFLGRLRKELDAQVQKCVTQELDKDLLQLDDRAIEQKMFASGGPAGA